MKKILLTIIVIPGFSLSCNKILGKTCWKCEVTRRDGSTYTDNVCRDDNQVPTFTDGQGNDLNAFCERK
jgi:hypothetical protein